jgi:hypothetical protein
VSPPLIASEVLSALPAPAVALANGAALFISDTETAIRLPGVGVEKPLEGLPRHRSVVPAA